MHDDGSPKSKNARHLPLQSQLFSLSSQVSALKSQLSSLSSQVSALKPQLSSLSSQLFSLSSQVSALFFIPRFNQLFDCLWRLCLFETERC
ncbi:Unannotated [Lentimonas sp. CC4]|nr:Unannotated [Lentimonas sp. CC4]